MCWMPFLSPNQQCHIVKGLALCTVYYVCCLMCVVQFMIKIVCCACTSYSREEPFTVLNIDIRNQQNLHESLEQYVKGDLLEGANAYHCEKCNKKVHVFEMSVTVVIITM